FCIDWAIAGVRATSIKTDDTSRRRMMDSFECSRRRNARRSQKVSKRKHVSYESFLVLLVQLQAEDQVEELDGVGERQQSPVVQLRWGVLDAAQGERLDRPSGQHDQPIHGLPDLVEALELQVMHLVIHE